MMRPEDATAVSALLERAEALGLAGKWSEALPKLAAALALEPASPIALYGHGNIAARAGARDAAIASLLRAIAVVPSFDLALADVGGQLQQAERSAEALPRLRRAIVLAPDYGVALLNYAEILVSQDLTAAFGASRRAFATMFSAAAEGSFLQRLHYDPATTTDQIHRAHLAWGRRHRKEAPPRFSLVTRPDRERPLTVAYLSADLFRHPVGFLLSAAIAHHDHRRLCVVICDTGTAWSDHLTEALKGMADRWLDLTGLSDDQAFETLRGAEIDICVDLSGHTPGNRLPVLTRRVAPVQVTWLGYWNTTGMPDMDFLLTCAEEVPPDRDRFFSERVVRLPLGRFCYAIPERIPPVKPPPSESSGTITFGCSVRGLPQPGEVSAWAEILRAVPGSQMVLRAGGLRDEQKRLSFLARLSALGVADVERRIHIHHARIPHELLYESYGDLDIALDSFPFSRLMTNLELLTMGVPVVSVGLERIESRQTLAILQRLGLGELAGTSIAEYVDIAVALAGDPERLRQLRRSLRSRVVERLCQGEAFCRDLEAAYRSMWHEVCDQAAAGPPR
jgi:predicted O-linked N-acetylglucosamine transferase (SPINDLY family)